MVPGALRVAPEREAASRRLGPDPCYGSRSTRAPEGFPPRTRGRRRARRPGETPARGDPKPTAAPCGVSGSTTRFGARGSTGQQANALAQPDRRTLAGTRRGVMEPPTRTRQWCAGLRVGARQAEAASDRPFGGVGCRPERGVHGIVTRAGSYREMRRQPAGRRRLKAPSASPQAVWRRVGEEATSGWSRTRPWRALPSGGRAGNPG